MPESQGEADWETLVSSWFEAQEREEEMRWLKGAMAAAVALTYGLCAIPLFAREVGCSAKELHKAKQTFLAFPDPASRAANLTFEHHFLASCTESPQHWLERAGAEQMSIRDLRRAIIAGESALQLPPPQPLLVREGAEIEPSEVYVGVALSYVSKTILSRGQMEELLRVLAEYCAANGWRDERMAEHLRRVFRIKEGERAS